MKPVGIGNSASELDLNVLVPGTQEDASGFGDIGPVALSENDDNEDDDRPHAQKKRSASVAGLEEDVKPNVMTPARPNLSKPTTTGPKSKKPKGLEELVEIAHAEEVTCQKQLDLQIQKVKERESKAQVKADVQKAVIEAKKEKAKQVHEVEMMKLQLELARVRQLALGIGAGEIRSPLNRGSVHPSGLFPSFSLSFGFGDDDQPDETSGDRGAMQ